VKGLGLSIVTYDAPVLRAVSRPVRRINRTVQQLIDEMIELMRGEQGIGLAAPQVGELRRVIVVEAENGPVSMVNPRIRERVGSVTALEGCLSLPGILAEVTRAEKVRVEYLDREGRRSWLDADGLLARAVQHEVDHLNGILITDRALSLIALGVGEGDGRCE